MAESSPETNSKEAIPRDDGAGENTQIQTLQSEEDRSDHDAPENAEADQSDGKPSAPQDDDPSESDDDSLTSLESVEIRSPSLGPLDFPYIARPGAPVYPPPGKPPDNATITDVKARTRLKQKHDQYILLLEDRITRLENLLTEFLPKPRPPQRPPPPRRTLIPKMIELFWSDYEDLMGYPDATGPPAIEVLVDLRSPRSAVDQMSLDTDLQSPTQPRNLVENQSTSNSPFQSTDPLDIKVDLPRRIRINTTGLLFLLDKISDKAILNGSLPQVFRRPFKAFVHYEKPILEALAESRKTLDPEAIERIENKLKEPSELVAPAVTGDNVDVENCCVLYELAAKFIATYLQPVMARVPRQTRVQFHELWFLFEPGQYVFVREKNCPQNVWRVLQTTGGNPYLSKRRPPPSRYPPKSQSYPPPPPPRIRTQRDPRGLGDSRETSNPYLSPQVFSPFLIDCYYIDFDGFRFRPVYRRFQIAKFEDNLLVSSLTVMPLAVAEEADLINQDERRKIGEQYLDCTKPSHRHFEGRTLDRNSIGDVLYLQASDESRTERRAVSESLEGRVMVDLTTAAEARPKWQPLYDELDLYKTPIEELQNEVYAPDTELIQDDYIIDQRRRDDFVRKEFTKFKLWNAETGTKPDGQDLLLLPDRVFAFVLRTRKWACLPLGFNEKGKPLLMKVTPEDDAWNDLQLPGGDDGHKHIIQSLIKKHFAKDMAIDLVRDKGRGLIILLHGIPGVGKTSTAECVAAANGKPLLPITCGDLGLSPKEVEENLEFHFQLAQAWDCVMLLDEADVFLARRTVEDVGRNALVSVFLRILEYYEGILFLTTNRVGTLDEAFRSRIHMSLYYPSLNEDQTKAIWKTLCRRAKSQQERLEIDEDEILDYASQHFDDLKKAGKGRTGGWNGRQIKNAFMSAIALAHYNVPEGHQVRLGISHFKKVAKASKEFDDYMMRTQAGRDAATWALLNQIRADDFPVNSLDGDPNVPMHFGVPPRQFLRQTQPVQQSNSFGMQMPYMPAMSQHGFPQQMGMAMPPQQFYGNQMPVQQMPQQQFYQSPQQGQMGQMQTSMPQQMGTPQQASMQQGIPTQSQGQAQTSVQQTQIPQQQQQQQQQGQQGFVPSYGQGGFMGQQS